MKPLVLVACERSGVVRRAFAARGWEAFSCDVLPACDGEEKAHYLGDVREILDCGWLLMICHPPCTFLSSSGMHRTVRGLRDASLTEKALAFVRELLAAPIPYIALENPVGVVGTRIRKADQYVEPFEFGHDAKKKTGLWLNNLPPLVCNPAERVAGRMVEHPPGSGRMRERWSNQTDAGQNRLSPGDGRAGERSKTYEGIAAAMAEQWTVAVGGAE